MKSYSLIVALFILLVVSTGFAETQPVPEDAEETIVEPTPVKHYSSLIAGFGNLIPGLGYFLIDEPVWGIVELGILAAGFGLKMAIEAVSSEHYNYVGTIIFMPIAGVTYVAGIIHAPLLASYKYNQQKVALDLSPGVGLDSEGEVYPTVQLTLSF